MALQGLMQDYQLLVLQELGGNQTCSSTLVVFSMCTLEILGKGKSTSQGWEIPVLPTL